MEAMLLRQFISTGPAELLISSIWQGLLLTILAWSALKLAPGLRASTRFTLWLIIFLVAVFQSFATGYSLKRRFWFSLVMTPVVVAVVMALLADLDSPHGGLITIRENSMQRLANDARDPPR